MTFAALMWKQFYLHFAHICMHICRYVIIPDLSLFLFLWVFKFIVAEMITPNQKDSEAVQSQTFLMK